jgi:dihydrolipoamide dehydrogenase
MLKIKDSYDVIVVGAGAGGCVCAIRCSQLGLKTLCIDIAQFGVDQGQNAVSGTYANSGNFARIALLESAKFYSSLLTESRVHGIYTDNVTLDLGKMIQRKDAILAETTQSITKIFKQNKIDFIQAKAKLLEEKIVEIASENYSPTKKIRAGHVVLATDSTPIPVPCAPIDNAFILDSAAALNLTEVPKRLAILGAGVLGLELAGIWNRLGAETILLEAQDTFLDLADHQISREAYRIFTGQGLELCLGTRVISTKISNKKVLIEYQDSDGHHAIRVDKLIVASGRKPNSDNLAAPEANLLLDENGYVHVNENLRTNLPGVYAIGDLTLLGPMLSHKAMAEGVFVAEKIAGVQCLPINYNIIPNVIYTEPEIAWVGQTEQALKAIRDTISVGIFPLSGNARAKSANKTHGLVKVIACAKSDTILGIHIMGSHASELIAEAALALEFSASSEDLTRTIHAHPSFSESLREAAMALKIK